MKKKFTLLLALILLSGLAIQTAMAETASKKTENAKRASSTSFSFILLGDMHYDKLEYHDMEWLNTKPGDLHQVTATYVPNTKNNWSDLMGVLAGRISSVTPQIKAVVQAGDISEGLAGSPEKATEMASGVMTALRDAKLEVPWIVAKGNHDVTGPGAEEAFTGYYVPFYREQTGDDSITNANYTYRTGNALFVTLDSWNRDGTDQVAFAEKALGESDAKYKFVIMHEPAFPVTERCWYFMRSAKAEKREKLLEVLAKNKAIVLTGHLHRYSVAKRETAYGPIVQVMAVSVVGKKRMSKPSYSFTLKDYGPGLVDWKPDYETKTADKRRAILTEEAKNVTYYTMCDLPGYAVITVDDASGEVSMSYYAAFESQPYDTVNLTKLYNGSQK